MPTRLLSLIAHNRYTLILLVVVAIPFLTGFQAVYGPGDEPDDCGCGPSDAGVVGGVVVDSVTSKPIAGAATTIDTMPPQTVDSDEIGGVHFGHLVGGEYKVSAAKAGYTPNYVIADVDGSGAFTDIKIVLVPLPGSLKGKVTDAKTPATPIANATVSLSGAGISTRTAPTDATGSYQFQNPPTGISLTLRATADKYDAKDFAPFTLAPGEDKAGVDFALTASTAPAPTGSVMVTVLDSSIATKVAATKITAVTFGGVPLTFRTTDSTYNLANATAGTNVPLVVTATGYTTVNRAVTLAAGQSLNITIPLSTVFPSNQGGTIPCLPTYRATLDWQRDSQGRPSDLDLLLVVPRAGVPAGCFLDNDRRGDMCGAPNAMVQVENTHATGTPSMESVDIARLNPGTYAIVVNDYLGGTDPKEPATTLGDPKTAATVTVYGPKGVVTATAPAPPASGYWYWIPFTINGATGDITPASPSFLPVGTPFTPQECKAF